MREDRRDDGFSLALGSGGARGLAHIGVVRVLEEAGLRPRAVAGTSMGAYVGAMYAAGIRPKVMAENARVLAGLVSRLSAVALRSGALLRTDRIDQMMREQLPPTFDDLSLPFGCVATDMLSGEPVAMTSGDLPKAVRASMSVPVLFEAVRDEGRLLSDGGLIDPVPVGLARALGGRSVVAVHVGRLASVAGARATDTSATDARVADAPAAETSAAWGAFEDVFVKGRTPGIVELGSRAMDVQAHWLAQAALGDADVVVTPDVGGFMFGDLSRLDAIIDVGVRSAIGAVPAIRAITARKREVPVVRLLRKAVAP